MSYHPAMNTWITFTKNLKMSNFYSFDEGLIGLIVTCIVLIAIPGPSIMFLIGQTISSGRSNALRAVLGNALGTYMVAVIVAIGVGTILLHSEGFISIVRGVGHWSSPGLAFNIFDRLLLRWRKGVQKLRDRVRQFFRAS